VYSYQRTNDNWASLINSNAIMSRANEESAIKSMRVRSSWDAKRKNIAKKRLTARCPYWLKPSEGDSGFEFIPERVEVVKRIFQMSLEGVGTGTIVKTLNMEDVPRFSDKTDGWQNSYIQKILSNPAIHGELNLSLQRNGQITHVDTIADYYPAIMTKAKWLTVASARASRRSRGGGGSKGKQLSNLFSGLLRCGYCDGPMNMAGYYKLRAGGKRKVDRYIACSNARRGRGCNFIQWPYADFEQLVLRFCKAVDFAQVLGMNQDGEAEINSSMQRLESLKLEIQDTSTKNQALLDALENVSEGERPQALIERIKANENKIATIEQNKRLIENQILLLTNSRVDITVQQNLIVDLLQRLETLQGIELLLLRIRLSEAIKRVVSKIITYPGGRWYTADEIEEYRRSLVASGEFDDATIKLLCAKLDKAPNKQNRLLMIEFRNGEHRTVLSSGKVLDLKTPPPSEWDIKTLFESLAFKVFKRIDA